MLGIFAQSFLTATRAANRAERREHWPRQQTSWLEEDLPFRNHAGRRSGRDD